MGSEVERAAQKPLLLFPIPSCPLRSATSTARHSTQGTGALPGSPETQPRPTVPTELQGKVDKTAARNQKGQGPFTGDHHKLLPFEEEPRKPQPPHHSRLLQDTCREKKDGPIRFLSKNKSNFHRQKSAASLHVKQGDGLHTCGDGSVRDAFSRRGVPTSTTIKPHFQRHFILGVKTCNSSPAEGTAEYLKRSNVLLCPSRLRVLA